MKHLVLLRHGAADDAKTDRKRRLTARGAAEARRAGEALRTLSGRGFTLDRGLCSDALRARETLTLAAGIADLPATKPDPALYLASPGVVFGVLQGLAAEARGALVVGHNPGLSELVQLLAAAGPPEIMARIPRGLGTGHLAALRLDVGGWDALAPGCGVLDAMGADVDASRRGSEGDA
jgi:phosphohistidine phosphatase